MSINNAIRMRIYCISIWIIIVNIYLFFNFFHFCSLVFFQVTLPNSIWNLPIYPGWPPHARIVHLTPLNNTLSTRTCPVVGRSRPAVVACCTVRSGVFHHWIHHLWPQGAVPPGFNPLRRGWVYRPAPEAPRKGECRRGPRHFWNCLSRWATALRQDPP